MSKKYRESTEGGILFIEGTANDLLRAIKALERRGFVNLFCGRPILRTGRLYLLEVNNGFYHVYRGEGGAR